MLGNPKEKGGSIKYAISHPLIGKDGYWDGHSVSDRKRGRQVLTGQAMWEVRRRNAAGYWGDIPVRVKTPEQIESEWLAELGAIMDRIWQ